NFNLHMVAALFVDQHQLAAWRESPLREIRLRQHLHIAANTMRIHKLANRIPFAVHAISPLPVFAYPYPLTFSIIALQEGRDIRPGPPACVPYEIMSTMTRLLDLTEAEVTTVRIALAIRPCLPITLPTSSG